MLLKLHTQSYRLKSKQNVGRQGFFPRLFLIGEERLVRCGGDGVKNSAEIF